MSLDVSIVQIQIVILGVDTVMEKINKTVVLLLMDIARYAQRNANGGPTKIKTT
jgi:hypothetical protein